MRCPYCDAENPDDYIFCGECWARLVSLTNIVQEDNVSKIVMGEYELVNRPDTFTPPVVKLLGPGSISTSKSTHATEARQVEMNVEEAPTGIADTTPNTPGLPGEPQPQSDGGINLIDPPTGLFIGNNFRKIIGIGATISLILGAFISLNIDPPLPLVTPTATATPTLTELPKEIATLLFPTSTIAPPPATATLQPVAPPIQVGTIDNVYLPFLAIWRRTEWPQAGVKRSPIWGAPVQTSKCGSIQMEDNVTVMVQYFEKGIMRVPIDPAKGTEPDLGLPVVELLMATPVPPSIRIIGLANNSSAPTYRTFKDNTTLLGEDGPPNRVGQTITQTLHANGQPGYLNESKQKKYEKEIENEARVAWYQEEVEGIRHNIPKVFWDYLNERGPVYINDSRPSEWGLIQGSHWSSITGQPISEAYWVEFGRGSGIEDALIQAFQRRILTYVPSNDTGFKVEMANTGRHYLDWKYMNKGNCP